MRRFGMISILSLSLLAVLSTGVLAASPATSFSVKANHAAQGGQLMVQAKARHSVKGDFSATAVVHFASGDVSVVLTRTGHSSRVSVKVPVSLTEQPGSVSVDVSITSNGATQTLTTHGVVNAASDDTGG